MKKVIVALVFIVFAVASCSKKSSPEGSAKSGAAIFAKNCARCHGKAGVKDSRTPNLQTIALDKDGLVKSITNGKMDMPAFGKKLSAQQISDVADLIVSWHAK